MRLFDAVRVPGAKLTVLTGVAVGESSVISMPENFQTAAADWVRVVADDCSEWFWKSEREYWRYDQHFGPLRLPFDKMWIEWKVPSKIYTADEGWRGSESMTAGVSMMASAPPHPEAPAGTAQTIITTWLQQTYGKVLVGIPVVQLMHVSAEGNYLRHEYMSEAGQTLAQLADGMSTGFDPAWLAIGLMNCKNVQITETKPPEKLAKATLKRRGVRPNSYHVISLPGRPSIRSNKQAAAAAGGAVPMHLVRGHFKTYTAEKPLLGKSTGTYWWGWHARGSEEAGRVDKHYVVGPKDGQK